MNAVILNHIATRYGERIRDDGCCETVTLWYRIDHRVSQRTVDAFHAKFDDGPSYPGGPYSRCAVWRTKRRTLVTVHHSYDI